MAAYFGRFFQLVGLVILPAGLLFGLAGGNIALEVRLLFIGAGFFLAGWLLAKRTE